MTDCCLDAEQIVKSGKDHPVYVAYFLHTRSVFNLSTSSSRRHSTTPISLSRDRGIRYIGLSNGIKMHRLRKSQSQPKVELVTVDLRLSTDLSWRPRSRHSCLLPVRDTSRTGGLSGREWMSGGRRPGGTAQRWCLAAWRPVFASKKKCDRPFFERSRATRMECLNSGGGRLRDRTLLRSY
ncbi:hypothetical protein VTO42DRAFT_1834 [Malbranchea cinnamomea]